MAVLRALVVWVLVLLACTDVATRPATALHVPSGGNKGETKGDANDQGTSLQASDTPSACAALTHPVFAQRMESLSVVLRRYLKFATGQQGKFAGAKFPASCPVDKLPDLIKETTKRARDVSMAKSVELAALSTAFVHAAMRAQLKPGGELFALSRPTASVEDIGVAGILQSKGGFEVATKLIKAGCVDSLVSGELDAAALAAVSDVSVEQAKTVVSMVGSYGSIDIDRLRMWLRSPESRRVDKSLRNAAHAIVKGPAGYLTFDLRAKVLALVEKVLAEHSGWNREATAAVVKVIAHKPVGRDDLVALTGMQASSVNELFAILDKENKGVLEHTQLIGFMSSKFDAKGKLREQDLEEDTDTAGEEGDADHGTAPDHAVDHKDAAAMRQALKDALKEAEKHIETQIQQLVASYGFDALKTVMQEDLGSIEKEASEIKEHVGMFATNPNQGMSGLQSIEMSVFKVLYRVFVGLTILAMFYGTLSAGEGRDYSPEGLARRLGLEWILPSAAHNNAAAAAATAAATALVGVGADAQRPQGPIGVLIQAQHRTATAATNAPDDLVPLPKEVAYFVGVLLALFVGMTFLSRVMWKRYGRRIFTRQAIIASFKEKWYSRSDFYGVLPLILVFALVIRVGRLYFDEAVNANDTSQCLLELLGLISLYRALLTQVRNGYGNTMLEHQDLVERYETQRKDNSEDEPVSEETLAELFGVFLSISRGNTDPNAEQKCIERLLPLASDFLSSPRNNHVAYEAMGTLTLSGMCYDAYNDARLEFVIDETSLMEDTLVRLSVAFQQSAARSKAMRVLTSVEVVGFTDAGDVVVSRTIPVPADHFAFTINIAAATRVEIAPTCKAELCALVFPSGVKGGTGDAYSMDVPAGTTEVLVPVTLYLRYGGEAQYDFTLVRRT